MNEFFNAWVENGAMVFNHFDLIFLNMTRMWCFIDLVAQDVDGFFFVFWNSFYKEIVTLRVAVVVVVAIKIIGFIIVMITYLLSKKPCTYDVVCENYYLESIFYQLIPFLIHFLTTIAITCYMVIKKYQFSKLAPIENNTNVNLIM